MAARVPRKLAFWGAVAGVSLLAPAGLELLANHIPSPGFQRLVAFVHRGGTTGGQ